MPSLLSLMAEIAPSRPPSPGLEPRSPLSPITKSKPEHLVPFHALIDDYRQAPVYPRLLPLAYVPLTILAEMLAFNQYRAEYLQEEPGFQLYPVINAKPTDVVLQTVKCVAFTVDVAMRGTKGMTKVMDELTWFMRGRGVIPIQRYHREDPMTVFADPRSGIFDPAFGICQDRDQMPAWGNKAMTMLRPILPRFMGLVMGVHLIVYEGEGRNMKVWMQRRHPDVHLGGMLDSTAGGGIEAGETPLDGACKEAHEEAGIPEDVVKRHAICTGIMTFQDVEYFPEPILNHMFELKRPDPSHPDYQATLPKGDNAECAEFEVLTVPKLIHALHARDVQPQAQPHFIYFLIRHGLISREDGEDVEEILWRCRSPLPVPLPHRLNEAIEVPVMKGAWYTK